MQTYSFFWYAGATPDFVWQAGTSILLDVFEDHSTPQNDVLFRFRNVIDNGYDEGGIVNLFMDTGSAGDLFSDVSIGARSAGSFFYNPGDLDPANLDSGQVAFLQFGKVALTPEMAWGRSETGLISGVNPGEFLSLRATLADGADISDVFGALDLGLAGNYTAAPYWGQMTSEELAEYKADASAGLRFGMLFHGVVPNYVNQDGHGLYVTGSLAGVSDDPGMGTNDDELVGDGGDNTLDGGLGADVMAGLAGNDTYYVDNFDDWVIEAAGQGIDTIVSSVSIVLPDNVENLVLRAISAEGNDLDNLIVASNGNNYIDGKGGIDTISYADAPGPVKIGLGLTSIQSTISSGKDMLLNFENVIGSAFDDTLTGSAGANVLDGGSGADTMSGGAGDDTYIVDNVGDVTTGEAGGVDTVRSSINWTLATGFENLVLTGGAVNGTGNSVANKLTGNALANVLTGLAGNDLLDGGAGADQMFGGVGNDTYVVDHAGDVVTEVSGEGTDAVESSISYTLSANVEKLVLTGSAALTGTGNASSNTLVGNGVANVLTGLEGNDTLDGGGGADQMAGGVGNDTYIVDHADDVVTELSGEGTDTVESSVSHTLRVNVENLTLTGSAALTGTGNALGNLITGNSATNTLHGLEGNDTLDGGGGADQLVGGTGNDTYVVDNAGVTITEVGGGGTDTVKSGISYTLGNELENLTLTGSAALNGSGNGLANTLTGNGSANLLDGGGGDDKLTGAGGRDTLTGGSGADTFDFNALADSVVGVDRDLVTDFSRAQGDKLDLSTIDGNTLLAGNQKFSFIGASAFSGVAGQLRAVFGGIAGGTLVQADVNGDGAADLEIGLAGVTTALVAGDFVAVTDGTATPPGGGGGGGGGTPGITVEGDDGDNLIAASNGDDYLDGKGGIDTVSYADAPGPVKVSISLTSVQATSGSGNDRVLNFENVVGSAFNDTLTGNTGANVIDGGAGADSMSGGSGDDTYVVDNLGDVVTGDTGGADTVRSSVSFTLPTGFENLVLTGNAPVAGTGNSLANRLTGNNADNVLIGLGGNDILDGGAGNDRMEGGVYHDTYIVDSAGDVVVELAGEGTDTVEASVSYALGDNVEKLVLTGSAALTGTGNTLGNTLTGNSAANTLYGLAGNDTLDGGAGADQMFGGTGNDTYIVDHAGDAVTEYEGEGTDTVQSSVTYTLGANVENLTLTGASALQGSGNSAANVLTGNSGVNTLYGLAGNDTLDGGGGADNLLGGTGNDTYVVDSVGVTITEFGGEGSDTVKSSIDYTLGAELEKLTLTGSADLLGTGNELANTLTGNTGNNVLDGGAGNDTLAGGKGMDSLFGGLGADKYDFNAIVDSIVGPDRDLVLDFSRGEGDRIDVSTIDANTLLSGNQVFSFIGESVFSGAGGQLRAVSGGIDGGTLVQADVNGDGVADFELGLAGVTASMVTADFVL